MKINSPNQAQIPALWTLWRETFQDPQEFIHDFAETAFHKDRCRIVTRNNEVAAALYWFDCLYQDKRIAYLYAVATAKKYRGQGICHRLMEDTHAHLIKLGYEGAILVPGSKELFGFYKRMGYATCSYIREFTCDAKAEEIKIRSVNLEEYGRLRRQYLPEGGVIQEKENLDFLKTQAKLYVGEDFLLVAREEEGTLFGLELLGDTLAASGILYTLGYPKGTFRVPGEEIPFAMYRPLGNSKQTSPTYFGLAFD